MPQLLHACILWHAGAPGGGSSQARSSPGGLSSVWGGTGTPSRRLSGEERQRRREAHADALAAEYERSIGSGFEEVGFLGACPDFLRPAQAKKSHVMLESHGLEVSFECSL
jgi:hypothetical protein